MISGYPQTPARGTDVRKCDGHHGMAETIETLAAADPPNALRFQEWCAIWEKCTRLEKGFWDMALNLL